MIIARSFFSDKWIFFLSLSGLLLKQMDSTTWSSHFSNVPSRFMLRFKFFTRDLIVPFGLSFRLLGRCSPLESVAKDAQSVCNNEFISLKLLTLACYYLYITMSKRYRGDENGAEKNSKS